MISCNEVVIVVPIYQECFSECEQASLKQVQRVLNRYSIVFVAPDRMRNYCSSNGLRALYFPDYHMDSIEAYSELLISPAFYHKFDSWCYMLIYQLDAFVFSDELCDFCNLGYDFIGAPWPYWYDNGDVKSHVGNGGLSLRKISSCERITSDKKLMNEWRKISPNNKLAEDLFFAYAAGIPRTGFVSAPVEISIRFSQEEEIRKCYRDVEKRQLPFGCHGWTKRNFYPFWKSIIERQGYHLPDMWPEDTALSIRRAKIAQLLTKRIIRGERERKAREIIRQILSINKKYAIHGGGVDGLRCLKLMQMMGLSPSKIYDQRATTLSISGYEISPPPVKEELRFTEDVIIIATFYHECEIADHYKCLGLVEGREYLLFSKLEKEFIKAVYGFMW